MFGKQSRKNQSISGALPFLCDSDLPVLCHSQTSSYRLPAATYLPPSLSSATYLPLPLPTYLPTTTCHYPPATTCHILPLPYLPISSNLYLPLPASLYLPLHYLPLPATTSTCQYLTLPAIACHYLLLLDYQLLRLIDMCYSIVKMWKHSKYQSSRALAYQTRVPNSPENNIFYVVLAADNTPTGQIEDQIK